MPEYLHFLGFKGRPVIILLTQIRLANYNKDDSRNRTLKTTYNKAFNKRAYKTIESLSGIETEDLEHLSAANPPYKTIESLSGIETFSWPVNRRNAEAYKTIESLSGIETVQFKCMLCQTL